jgi:hypothetical protein
MESFLELETFTLAILFSRRRRRRRMMMMMMMMRRRRRKRRKRRRFARTILHTKGTGVHVVAARPWYWNVTARLR